MVTAAKIYQLHQKYSHGEYSKEVLDLVWTHSCIVKEIALIISSNLKQNCGIEADNKLITIGALVHDIGVYNCFDDKFQSTVPYITHGLIGYKLLRDQKIKENIARFSLCHTTTGLTWQTIASQNIPLPVRDYIPITLEEEIVSYADAFHSKGRPRILSYEEASVNYAKFESPAVFMLDRFSKKFGVPCLESLKLKYEPWHQQITAWMQSVRAVI